MPSAGNLVLLADTSVVREPYCYLAAIDLLRARDCVQTRGEVFFKILNRTRGLRVMTWPRRQLAIAHSPQLPTQGPLDDGDAELFEYSLRQVDQPPGHHVVNRRDRPLSIIWVIAWRWPSLSLEGWPWRLSGSLDRQGLSG